jgi:hypothetical protein
MRSGAASGPGMGVGVALGPVMRSGAAPGPRPRLGARTSCRYPLRLSSSPMSTVQCEVRMMCTELRGRGVRGRGLEQAAHCLALTCLAPSICAAGW